MYTHNYPEDSVLRRHYEQLRNSGHLALSRKSEGSSSATNPKIDKPGSFGWLRRLFGG